jgi:4-amino-4-deoxy-L-arabinose transferase-like glycosyltransferase
MTTTTQDPRWVRPALIGLLGATAVLHFWSLTVSGWANAYYSAAVQAGSESWKAFFFGSLDASNSITVDKPSLSLWPMALSVRLFGLHSWTILAPQVLMGLATVGVLFAAVRRRFGPVAGLIAGAVLALTPVAVLMFRYNNPDALLTLLLTVAIYFVLRALEDGRTKWMMLAGAVIGAAFLAKTLQAFLILPVLALVYLLCAPVKVGKRVGQLLLAGLAMVVAGGWWVAIVELWPASSRPYIGGSENNSFLNLTFGYNGLGRINGNEMPGGGGGSGGFRGGRPFSQESGIGRMFASAVGGQISWLLPAALILLVAGLVLVWKTKAARSAFLVWGGSLLVTTIVFSFMKGTFHEYYTVAMAPYVGASIGMGTVTLWKHRHRLWVLATLSGSVILTAAWAFVLLNRTPEYVPWLKWFVLLGGLIAAAALLLTDQLGRRVAMGAVALAGVASLAGPVAYSLTTIGDGHNGGIITAGPASARMGGMGGGMGRGGGQLPNGTGDFEGGAQGGFPGGMRSQGVSAQLKELLTKDADKYTWVAATVSSQTSADLQLSSEKPVMAIGGFSGGDPSPTLEQFKQYVDEGRIHYFAGGNRGGGPGGGRGTAAAITSWVEQTFQQVTVDGTTLYDLTQPRTS